MDDEDSPRMWQAHERRIARLEQEFSDMHNRMGELQSAVKSNTEITRQIAEDTRAIRDMSRGGRVMGSVVLWLSGIVASVYAVLQFFKGT